MLSTSAIPVAPRIRNHNILKPIAVVDWVSFIVQLKKASHPGYLKRKYEAVGVSRVIPLNSGEGSAATDFRIELQHPENYQVIQDLIDSLHKCYRLSAPPVLDGLEVATDFWPLTEDPEELPDITKRLMLSIKPPVIKNPRLINGHRRVIRPRRTEIDPEMTLYIGNDKGDDLLWRVYWKRTDETYIGENNKRVPKPLPKSEWRARAEVRILGEALIDLGLKTPSDLEDFRFERLYSLGYFKFCKRSARPAMIGANPYSQCAAKGFGIDEDSPACMLSTYARRDSRERSLKQSRNLVTDTELTDAARGALRGLTGRF